MKIKQLIAGGAVFLSILIGSIPVQADPNIYKVAYIYPEVLIVRAKPDINSREIDRVYQGQEVEVVQECGDWAKVCITLDSYGYINAYHFAYKTYYGNGNTESPKEEYEKEENIYKEYNSNFEESESYNEEVNEETSYEEEDYENEKDESYDVDIYEEEEDEEPYDEEEDYEPYDENESYDEEEDYELYDEEDDESSDLDDLEVYEDEEDSSSGTSGQSIVDYARQYIGNPYVYGGESLTDGADCSGFTQTVFADNGISLAGRTAAEQAEGGREVSMDDLQAGDLLFYDNGNGIGHVSIYTGEDTVVHASSSTTGIIESDVNYREAVTARRYWD